MQNVKLQDLDQRTIAIELTVQGQKGMLNGVGQFDTNFVDEPALRVKVSHPAGDFEVVLRESQFTGRIETGEQFGRDFAIYLQRD